MWLYYVCLLLLTLSSQCQSTGLCPELNVPSYGLLYFNGSDVTQSQPNYAENDTVDYRCASGYRLINVISGAEQTDSSTTCVGDGSWTLEGVTCTILTTVEILAIVVAGLGSICIILFFNCLFSCCYACRLRRKLYGDDLAEDEIALARAQGAFTLSNPLTVGVKDEDAAGNPLYLTPDEMDEFEKQH